MFIQLTVVTILLVYSDALVTLRCVVFVQVVEFLT